MLFSSRLLHWNVWVYCSVKFKHQHTKRYYWWDMGWVDKKWNYLTYRLGLLLYVCWHLLGFTQQFWIHGNAPAVITNIAVSIHIVLALSGRCNTFCSAPVTLSSFSHGFTNAVWIEWNGTALGAFESRCIFWKGNVVYKFIRHGLAVHCIGETELFE